ncbi:EAL domain-containing protein [Stenotrophomonas sp. MMGLT7]|uniref:sensor domain-containing protein n=1 Tax=Stenotrophomonas sp. MMGLT7 TaxID=2901227 RepID=UPI001E5C8D81|nr:EAL domain-containing protein [Stenotrophomonas sp. MMGLT7]MCD7097100.1 EAL domain-containing protein [Stenotrophomonas sp. MMGLT7]
MVDTSTPPQKSPAPLPAGHAEQAASLLLQSLEQAPDGVLLVDATGRVALFNQAAAAIWKRPREQVVGQPLQALLPPAACERVLGGTQAPDHGPIELEPAMPDGSQPPAISLTTSEVVHGADRLHLCLVRDIGGQRQQEAHARLLSQALNYSNNAIVICDRDGRIVHANEGFRRMFGYSAEEASGSRPSDLLPGRYTDPETVARVRRLGQQLQPFSGDMLLYHKNGEPLWASVISNRILDEDGQITHTVGVLTDITQSKMHEVLHHRALEAIVREKPLQEIMELICREVERIVPSAVASVLSLDAQGVLHPLAAPGLPATFSERLGGIPIGPCHGACGTAAWRGSPVMVTDIASDPLFERCRPLMLEFGLRACWSTPIKSSSGRVLGTFALYYREPRAPDDWHIRLAELCRYVCALALEREQTRERLHRLAFYDGLTELPNRLMFSARAEQALVHAEGASVPLAVMFMDLDRLKRINETQGHAAGDGLVRDTAKRLSASVSGTDLVGRQVGDEFLLLLPHCDAGRAANVAERLLGAVSAPLVVGQMTLRPSASVGIAMFPDNGRDIETLLRNANLAMHRAKEEGGGCFSFFSDEMNRMAQERIAMENSLRDAVRQEQLHLHYQPQVHSDAPHRLYGVEALLRWQHPLLGWVSPARFIPLAEQSGLIDEITLWVLRQSCRQLANWRERGIPVPHVAVNLSASNFENPGLLQDLQQVLRSHGLTPADLTLEITESVMLSPRPHVLENLKAMQKAGFGFSLDDFGTGYSSLGNLYRLSINELKLDMSFVRDLDSSEVARTVTVSVLNLGRNLRKHVIAEGVESQSQADFLAEQGCEVLQGFLFSPPLPVEDLETWLEQRSPATSG